MAEIKKASGGGRFEQIGSYSRAIRVGPFAFVAGTTAIEPSGKLHAPGDTYAQTHYALDRVERALNDVGVAMTDVVRTRFTFADGSTAAEAVRAHGERFRGVDPVLTGVQGGLSMPHMMVEIEVDAIVSADVDD